MKPAIRCAMMRCSETGRCRLPLASPICRRPACRPSCPNRCRRVGSSGIQPVPSLFVRHMPNDMASLPTAEKKQTFIRIVLPLVLQANRDIRREQLLLDRARQKGNTGLLLKFAQKYRLDASLSADQLLAELDRRVQEVPVSLALAQAAVRIRLGQFALHPARQRALRPMGLDIRGRNKTSGSQQQPGGYPQLPQPVCLRARLYDQSEQPLGLC